MFELLSITAPIFIIVALGYLAVYQKVITAEAVGGIGRIVLTILMPAMIVNTLSKVELSQVAEPVYLLAYGGGSLIAFLSIFALSALMLGRDSVESTVKGLGSAVSNSAFFGFPVVMQFLGEPPAVAFTLGLMVENLLIIPLAMVLFELTGRGKSEFNPVMTVVITIKRVLFNPLIIAILVGLAISLFQVQLPAAVDASIQMLATTAAPIALLVIGGSLVGAPIMGNNLDIGLVACAKLILHPLAVVFMLMLLPPLDAQLKQAAILFAAMPMMSIYPIIAGNYGYRSICSSILLVTTMLSFITITVVVALI